MIRNTAGIDIGARTIKCVEVDAAGHPLRAAVVARHDSESPFSELDAARTAGAMLRAGFSAERVFVGASASVTMDLIDLPPKSSGAPVDVIARGEIARLRGLDDGAFETQVWEVPGASRASTGTKSVAVSCAHKPAMQILDAIESAGLDPVGIGIPVLAAGRVVFENSSGVLVDIGSEHAHIAFFVDGVLLYERRTPDAGIGALARPLETAFGLTPDLAAETLAAALHRGRSLPPRHNAELQRAKHAVIARIGTDLDRATAYVQRLTGGAAFDRAVLIGGGAPLLGDPRELAGPWHIPVESIALPGVTFRQSVSLLAGAIGLARVGRDA